jgi:transaldolase
MSTTPKSLLHQMTLEQPTQFWNDSCEVDSLKRAIEHGATGATSNPVIVLEAIEADRPRWLEITAALVREHPAESEEDLAWRIVARAATEAAALLEQVFEAHDGRAGRLSVQVNPRHYTDAQRMVAHAEELYGLAPNMAIKVPAVAAGIEAMEELTARGVVVNATVCFTLPQAIAVAEAIERGLKRAKAGGLETERLTPWVTIMVGRLDDHLRDQQAAGATEAQRAFDVERIRLASRAVMRRAYAIFRQRGYRATLLAAAMRSHHHWSDFIGGDLVVTIPPAWQETFNASGVQLRPRIDEPVDQAALQALLEAFPDFKRAYEEQGLEPEAFVTFGATVKTLHQFLDGYDKLLRFVREVMLPR